jgi:serine/threonine-protein kinase
VALKVPISHLREDLVSRFERERDILAGLEHPNIARLYDGGVGPDGLPYLAMEYVAGQPITSWCDVYRLGVRERLRLYLQVLDAVVYAHARGVIHRDLKPSNILVTVAGQVRLVDFGIATLLAGQEPSELTQMYGRALTPEYASPEFVRGEPLEQASDVFSLGIVLYELLTGSRPYRLPERSSALRLQRAIAMARVELPSGQVGQEAAAARGSTEKALARTLRGDLDAIVMKALAKESDQRYSGVGPLAGDVRRYLSGARVSVRPDGLAYRLANFVQRHRVALALGSAIALLVVAIGYRLM